jgi:putative FmdB family regulatory protein
MPTYDYHCDACGQDFEAFQRMSDPPLEKCANEACGATGSVRRLMGTGGGLIFKGSGFYITDYRDAGKAKPTAGDGGEKSAPSEAVAASGESGAKSEAKGEGKAEAKKDSKSSGESKSGGAAEKSPAPSASGSGSGSGSSGAGEAKSSTTAPANSKS